MKLLLLSPYKLIPVRDDIGEMLLRHLYRAEVAVVGGQPKEIRLILLAQFSLLLCAISQTGLFAAISPCPIHSWQDVPKFTVSVNCTTFDALITSCAAGLQANIRCLIRNQLVFKNETLFDLPGFAGLSHFSFCFSGVLLRRCATSSTTTTFLPADPSSSLSLFSVHPAIPG